MGYGRALSAAASTAAVAGCAVLVVTMGARGVHHDAAATPSPSDSASTSIPATLHSPTATAAPTPVVTTSTTSTAGPSTSGSTRPPAPPVSTRAPAPVPASAHAPTYTPTAPHPSSRPTRAPAPVRGVALPLGYSTGSATRVITVTASRTSSTVATLQAWQKAPGGGWLRYSSAVTAHIGSQGMTTSPSESKSATPMGSYTLTQAFGHYANPGTPLPYFQTNGADWWISQSGSLYNTHQHCSGSCPFNQGNPNEHLYYETPYYNYAVVIDYNTRNAPGGVRQGAGSAFFLHVTDGGSTAGCVAIPQANLVALMRWLAPSTAPRILIGVG